jgi:4-oxalocrotonate tautomerase family enzyme
MPYVNVTVAAGRSKEHARRIMKAVFNALRESVGAPHQSIRLWISEVPPHKTSVGVVSLDVLGSDRDHVPQRSERTDNDDVE